MEKGASPLVPGVQVPLPPHSSFLFSILPSCAVWSPPQPVVPGPALSAAELAAVVSDLPCICGAQQAWFDAHAAASAGLPCLPLLLPGSTFSEPKSIDPGPAWNPEANLSRFLVRFLLVAGTGLCHAGRAAPEGKPGWGERPGCCLGHHPASSHSSQL